MNLIRALSAAGAAMVAMSPAIGDVVTIGANHDNTLYEDVAGSLSNGAGSGMFAGTSGQELIRRAVVSFDVASSIPAGSIITDARLTLHLSRSAGGANSVTLNRTLAAWGEGTSVAAGEQGQGAGATANDATWVHTFFPGQTWAGAGGGPGGYFVTAPSASLNVGSATAFYTWQSGGLASDVQSWLDVPATNFGWTILGDEEFAGTAKRFDTHEHPDIGVRPQLRITYTPVPGPTSVVVFCAAWVATGARRRRVPLNLG